MLPRRACRPPGSRAKNPQAHDGLRQPRAADSGPRLRRWPPRRTNVMVWDRTPGHYEFWYITFNHRPTRTGFWIRYGDRVAQGRRAPTGCSGSPASTPTIQARTWRVHTEVPIATLGRRLPALQSEARRRRARPRSRPRAGSGAGGHGRQMGSLVAAGADVRTATSPDVIYKTSFAEHARRLGRTSTCRSAAPVTSTGGASPSRGVPGDETHLWGSQARAPPGPGATATAFEGPAAAAVLEILFGPG